ncbi:YcgN family cysteine cluster protein [Thiohalomonas denitrificans]|uniref:YcgN family cysteine cluster protein n=1 Tax=Thiohalomonas denitrificans TaxID=415747 RepID=UPI0026EB04E9|nr:YcgN family cysteine cluster protein [Thiohalomonas denitrificans]
MPSEPECEPPFWERKSLDSMDAAEWEAVCDGCARCCLHKLEDEDSGEVFYTQVVCRYLEQDTCSCGEYSDRHRLQPDCVVLTRKAVDDFFWLPATCAYRLLAEGQPLPSWHPLVSGDPESVHEAGVSVRSFAIPEAQLESEDDLEDHIINLNREAD